MLYSLKSTKEHGSYVLDYRCNPRVFKNVMEAWLFKAKHRKWHWKVVAVPESWAREEQAYDQQSQRSLNF